MKKPLYILLIICFLPILLKAQEENTFPEMTKVNNGFGISMYQTIVSDPSDVGRDNLIFSPISITTALMMTYAGAKGETAQAFEDVFQVSNGYEKHYEFGEYLETLQEANNAENIIAIANSLWPQEGLFIQKPYQTILSECYKDSVYYVDFQNNTEAARQKINQWISDKTQKLIPELLKSYHLDPPPSLAIVNALYFKGKWDSSFEESNTKKDSFYTESGQISQVPFMHHRINRIFGYKEYNDFMVLYLPFQIDFLSPVSFMTLVLPKENIPLIELEEKITSDFYEENIHIIGKQLFFGEVSNKPVEAIDLYLPKFKVRTPLELKEILEQMGLEIIFNQAKADFSGINSKLFVSKVIHEAFLQVNEEGAEGGAATAVLSVERGGGGAIELKFNRPFLFYLCEGQTGSILFQGRITNPEY